MNCSKCPLNKSGKPTIRRQSEFKHKLRIVMANPAMNFMDPKIMEPSTIATIKRWIDEPFDVVFTLNCTAGRLLNRTDDEHLPAIAKTSREALKCCSGSLKEDLKGAEVVVLCGNRTLEAFGIKEKVSDLTGWVARENGVTYLATWDVHDVEDYPMDKWKDFAWTVQRAQDIVRGLAPNENEARSTPWVDIDSIEKLKDYVEVIQDRAIVSVDLETDGLEYWDKTKPILQIGIWDIKGHSDPGVIRPDVFNDPDFVSIWNEFNKRTRFLGQNHKFDHCYTKSQIPGAEFILTYELRLIHHLIDERTGTHSLGRMLRVYKNYKDYWSKLEHEFLKTKLGYGKADYNELGDYLGLDLIGNGELFLEFIPMLIDSKKNNKNKWPVLLSQVDQVEKIYPSLCNVLAGIELRGSRIDKDELFRLREEYTPKVEDQRNSIEGRLLDLTGEEYSVDSPSQLLAALQKAKILSPKITSVKKRVLADFMDNELVKDILSYRSDKKLLDSFINGSIERMIEMSPEDFRLMCKFDPAGTIGSRWTAFNPNLQQLPRKGPFKGIFIPSRAGRIIVQSDFSSLEARVAAYLSGDEALRDGCIGDLHKMVSEKSFGKYHAELARIDRLSELMELLSSQGLLMPAFKACSSMVVEEGEDPLQKAIKLTKDHLRNCAKVITYGIFFGRGPRALAVQELSCSEEEARYFIDEYFKLFPKLHEWILHVHKVVEDVGIIEEPGGLRRDLRGWMFSSEAHIRQRFLAEAKRKAVNFLTQVFGGSIQNLAVAKTDGYLQLHGVGEVRKGVHDSTVYEIDYNSDTRYHITEVDKLQKVIKNPHWLCETDTECGPNYGKLVKVDKFFSAVS